MQFLQNTWYASASIDEVTVRALLKHTIINQPLVIFSTARSLVTWRIAVSTDFRR